jgi:diguanylate cyclase (GGDEF)-like protein
MLIGVLVLGFLVTSIVSYFIAEDSLNKRIAGEILPLTSDNIYSEIERDLLRSILISSLMAHDTFLQDWIIEGEENPEQVIRYLGEIQRKYSTTTAFFISDRTYNYYHLTGILKQIDPEDNADAWYFRVRDMNTPYEVNIDHDTADRSRVTIFINYRVISRNGDFLGITGIGLSVDTVAQLIETYQKRYGRQIYFIDREGNVTLHSDDYDEETNIQARPGLGRFATQILASPGSSITYQHPDGEVVYVNSRLVPEFGWYLLVEQSKSAAEAHLLNTLMVNILIALLIAALAVVVVYLTIRRYQHRLEQMATTDKLTGAANRHIFHAIFNHVAATTRRRREPVALMCIDIDDFKEVNDTYGHQTGDNVLRQFADIVRNNIRETDTFCRWGGDEFLVLMGNCTIDSAGQVAEKIRAAIAGHAFRFADGEHHLSVSIGIAQHQHGDQMEILVKRADAALYESKRQGRNRVVYA